ncbi:MAG: aldo/keto reductase, partial [Planctomycetota bacterium]
AGANLAVNTDRFAPLLRLAQELAITPAQLALAWLLARGDDVVPIPGPRKVARIDENAHATQIRLDAARLRRLDELARPGLATGNTLI